MDEVVVGPDAAHVGAVPALEGRCDQDVVAFERAAGDAFCVPRLIPGGPEADRLITRLHRLPPCVFLRLVLMLVPVKDDPPAQQFGEVGSATERMSISMLKRAPWAWIPADRYALIGAGHRAGMFVGALCGPPRLRRTARRFRRYQRPSHGGPRRKCRRRRSAARAVLPRRPLRPRDARRDAARLPHLATTLTTRMPSYICRARSTATST